MALKCGNEGLNLEKLCRHNIFIEQGTNLLAEHQAWSRVRHVSQRHPQTMTRLINYDNIDRWIERGHLSHVGGITEVLNQRNMVQVGNQSLSTQELWTHILGTGQDTEKDRMFGMTLGQHYPHVVISLEDDDDDLYTDPQ